MPILRRHGAGLPWRLIGPLLPVITFVVLFLFEPFSHAASVRVSGGLRVNVLSLDRTGKLAATGKHIEGGSDDTGGVGFALNINAGRFFLGSDFYDMGSVEYRSDRHLDNDPNGYLTGEVEISEANLALGFWVFRGVGPYLAYTAHRQNPSGSCPGCSGNESFSLVGPGLSLNYVFPGTRWGGFTRGSTVKGGGVKSYNFEGGFSYSGIRLPLVATASFRRRLTTFSPGDVPCVEGVAACYVRRDIISGPVVSLYFIF